MVFEPSLMARDDQCPQRALGSSRRGEKPYGIFGPPDLRVGTLQHAGRIHLLAARNCQTGQNLTNELLWSRTATKLTAWMKTAVSTAPDAGTPLGVGGSRVLRGYCEEHESLECLLLHRGHRSHSLATLGFLPEEPFRHDGRFANVCRTDTITARDFKQVMRVISRWWGPKLATFLRTKPAAPAARQYGLRDAAVLCDSGRPR